MYACGVAAGRALADLAGEPTALREETPACPGPLCEALVAASWEADFLVVNARKSAGAGDVLHVALCLSRAVGVLTQSLHAHHRVWCLNEKGALAAADALPGVPSGFRARAESVLSGLGDPVAAVEAASTLVAQVRAALG